MQIPANIPTYVNTQMTSNSLSINDKPSQSKENVVDSNLPQLSVGGGIARPKPNIMAQESLHNSVNNDDSPLTVANNSDNDNGTISILV
ncbi:hypothetical protein HQQ94_08295 [Shewanella sp. VB17]|uniref:hypothetical protein n=1 Tax=Shewanella sp. VB17 TaxID=2739432 RepID=UPI0015646910|nr:hypothetical protein [Shewanella sp. VB17]NRD73242.1 hypothetical protein [Shewanella sp. VB17]